MIKKITTVFTFAAVALLSNNVNAQTTHFTEDFEGGSTGWSLTSEDTDNVSWDIYDWTNGGQAGPNGQFGTQSLVSFSSNQGTAINPNNLAISPSISIPADNADGKRLKFTVAAGSADNFAETVSVYVTTSDDPTTILAADPVFEATFEDAFIRTEVIDVSAFAGQDVHITFRHHTATAQLAVVLDNVSVSTYDAYDVEMTEVNLSKYNELNAEAPVSFLIKNLGAEDLNSVTLKWSDGETEYEETFTFDTPVPTESFAFISNEEGNSYYSFTEQASYSEVVNKDITVSVVNINGTETDMNTDNDEASSKFITVSSKPSRKVFIEALNGTWAGDVTTSGDVLATLTGDNFAGVSVHAPSNTDTDPLAYVDYLQNVTGLTNLTQYKVDRIANNLSVDSQSTADYLDMEEAITEASDFVVPVTISAETNGSSDDVSIELTANFVSTMPDADLRFAVILTEDDVDANGESYDNVAREMILGEYDGVEGSIAGADIVDGQSKTHTFNYSLGNGFDFNKVNIVALVIDAETGRVLNSEKIYLDRWLDTEEQTIETIGLKAFPNPASDVLNVSFDGQGDYSITITDMLGKKVFSQKYTNLKGAQSIALPVSNLETGNYILNVHNGSSSNIQKISIK
ncbi:T9SS-dependent choice-of-anchor J family protein [Aureivirga sp. CE67]|uniref:T9SS-dependent choice-of-anchor J family protein n=1 Tax=Aureivirga sp. CE67 TaxID=1788983 RepID=UPI0018C95599|nr:T9SS type A sorting domain-containing protein [Aureivirga sp. CE67]